MANINLGKSIEDLTEDLARVRGNIAKLEAEQRQAEVDLAGYDTEGYRYFKTQVLTRELVRLDEVRRTQVDPSDSVAQERIHGQQYEVMHLQRSEDNLREFVAVCKSRLIRAYRERDGLQAKIARKVEQNGRRSNTGSDSNS